MSNSQEDTETQTNTVYNHNLMAVLCGMPTIQYLARSAAICATVQLLYNVFFKLNDLHISTSVPATLKQVPVRCTIRKKALQ